MGKPRETTWVSIGLVVVPFISAVTRRWRRWKYPMGLMRRLAPTEFCTSPEAEPAPTSCSHRAVALPKIIRPNTFDEESTKKKMPGRRVDFGGGGISGILGPSPNQPRTIEKKNAFLTFHFLPFGAQIGRRWPTTSNWLAWLKFPLLLETQQRTGEKSGPERKSAINIPQC